MARSLCRKKFSQIKNGVQKENPPVWRKKSSSNRNNRGARRKMKLNNAACFESNFKMGTMKRPRTIWLVLLAATIAVLAYPLFEPLSTSIIKIKIENETAVVSSMEATNPGHSFGYDYTYNPVNHVSTL